MSAVHKSSASCGSTYPAARASSQSDVSEQSNILHFPVRETRRGPDFQMWFPNAFGRYLRASFERPEDVAAVYRVRMSTAWKWWNGESGASGHQVMRTVMSDPEALAFFLSDWHSVPIKAISIEVGA